MLPLGEESMYCDIGQHIMFQNLFNLSSR